MAIDTKDVTKLKGVQKAAIVMLSMSDQNATKVLSMLSEDEIKEVSHAMSQLGSVTSEVVDKILQQFLSSFSGESNFFGSVQSTQKLLEKVLDKSRVQILMEEIQGPQGKNTWEKLGNVSEEMLATYLKNEHPQTAALILSKMTSNHAAKVISNLPEQFSLEIIRRMLRMGSVKKDVLDRVERILRAEFISSISKTHKRDSYEMMADIFNSLDRNTESKFMDMLEKESPEDAEKIKNLMFTFEDLIKIGTDGAQILLRSIDKSKLTLALKGSSEKIKDLFLSSMSQRAARIIQDELEALGPVKVKDVDEAQSQIIGVTKELIAKGEISVSEEGGDEYI
ncbi:MAG: flagellar motor switch protein FliG [Rickettsiaceae bacterium]|nr:flagellar motor switch protein FliG [Rickettsiaceae bacterium]